VGGSKSVCVTCIGIQLSMQRHQSTSPKI